MNTLQLFYRTLEKKGARDRRCRDSTIAPLMSLPLVTRLDADDITTSFGAGGLASAREQILRKLGRGPAVATEPRCR